MTLSVYILLGIVIVLIGVTGALLAREAIRAGDENRQIDEWLKRLNERPADRDEEGR